MAQFPPGGLVEVVSLHGHLAHLALRITTLIATLKAGSARALAMSTPRRVAALPNMLTFAKPGYGKSNGSQGQDLPASKGLPAPIAQRLSAMGAGMLACPGVATRLEVLQTLPRTPTLVGDEFLQRVRTQIDAGRQVARVAKVQMTG